MLWLLKMPRKFLYCIRLLIMLFTMSYELSNHSTGWTLMLLLMYGILKKNYSIWHLALILRNRVQMSAWKSVFECITILRAFYTRINCMISLPLLILTLTIPGYNPSPKKVIKYLQIIKNSSSVFSWESFCTKDIWKGVLEDLLTFSQKGILVSYPMWYASLLM